MRELRNFTQEYMAEKLHIKQASYSNIENGVADIKFSQMEKIAKVLQVATSDLINFDEKKVFNISNDMSNNSGENQTGVIFQDTTNTEKQLYEKMLAMQKERIVFLESLIKSHLKVEL